MYHSLFCHSSTEQHLNCFQVLAIIIKLLSTSICRFLYGHKFSFGLGKFQDVWLLACVIRIYIYFVGNCQTVFQSGYIILHSHQQMNESPCCSSSLSAFGIVSVLDLGYSNACIVVPHYCFNLWFPNDVWYWKYFYTLTGFPSGLVGKESSCNAGDPGSIPG